jgi:hypothetical protein
VVVVGGIQGLLYYGCTHVGTTPMVLWKPIIVFYVFWNFLHVHCVPEAITSSSFIGFWPMSNDWKAWEVSSQKWSFPKLLQAVSSLADAKKFITLRPFVVSRSVPVGKLRNFSTSLMFKSKSDFGHKGRETSNLSQLRGQDMIYCYFSLSLSCHLTIA